MPLHPEVDEDTHHVLTNQEDTILSEDLQTAVQAFQQSMRDIQKMQSAVQHSQTKVTEYVYIVALQSGLVQTATKHNTPLPVVKSLLTCAVCPAKDCVVVVVVVMDHC